MCVIFSWFFMLVYMFFKLALCDLFCGCTTMEVWRQTLLEILSIKFALQDNVIFLTQKVAHDTCVR
jgi:hypothetical protein